MPIQTLVLDLDCEKIVSSLARKFNKIPYDEVLHEANYIYYQAKKTFKPGIGKFPSFFYTLFNRELGKLCDKHQYDGSLVYLEDINGDLEHNTRKEYYRNLPGKQKDLDSYRRIMQVLQGILPKDEVELLEEVYVKGIKITELAKRDKVTRACINLQKTTILKKVRMRLKHNKDLELYILDINKFIQKILKEEKQ